MIRRLHRITFRLTEKEFQRFSPLLRGNWHTMSWSDLVRFSLEQEAVRRDPPTSDNGVRQGELPSDTAGIVRQTRKKTGKVGKKSVKPQKKR